LWEVSGWNYNHEEAKSGMDAGRYIAVSAGRAGTASVVVQPHRNTHVTYSHFALESVQHRAPIAVINQQNRAELQNERVTNQVLDFRINCDIHNDI
jgi:hypothetical protein